MSNCNTTSTNYRTTSCKSLNIDKSRVHVITVHREVHTEKSARRRALAADTRTKRNLKAEADGQMKEALVATCRWWGGWCWHEIAPPVSTQHTNNNYSHMLDIIPMYLRAFYVANVEDATCYDAQHRHQTIMRNHNTLLPVPQALAAATDCQGWRIALLIADAADNDAELLHQEHPQFHLQVERANGNRSVINSPVVKCT